MKFSGFCFKQWKDKVVTLQCYQEDRFPIISNNELFGPKFKETLPATFMNFDLEMDNSTVPEESS